MSSNVMSTSTFDRPNELNTYKQILVCGYCEMPDYYHVDEQRDIMQDRKPCERDYLDWSSIEDYDYTLQVANNSITEVPFKDYSGNEASIVTLINEAREWEWDCMYEDANRELTYGTFNALATATGYDKYDSWKDNESTICTTALQGYNYSDSEVAVLKTMTEFSQPGVAASNYATDERRNAYVEGFAGYTTERIIDEFKTRNYQARLLNVFTDKKTHLLRCGSIEFTRNHEGVTARCVKCQATMFRGLSIPFATPTREDMELFVYACISHGNNHAAAFIVNRPDYYTLQPANEWQYNKHSTPVWLTTEVENYDEAINFLYDHARYCSATNCQHDHYINVLMQSVITETEYAA